MTLTQRRPMEVFVTGGTGVLGRPTIRRLVAASHTVRGLAPFVGRKDAFVSHVWVDDASAAVLAALERAPAGVYDVADDEPLPRGELVGLVAQVAGRGRLVVPPTLLIRLLAGRKALFVGRSH